MDEQIEMYVREALRNSAENGDTWEGFTNRQIAEDMCTHDADLEIFAVVEVERVLDRIRP